MKLLIKNLALVAMLVLSTSGIAATVEPVFHIKVSAEKTIQFDTKGIQSSTVEVTFADAMGEVLFTEYTTHPKSFERVYNLEELADGVYFLLIKSDEETQKLIVKIKEGKLDINMKNLERL